MTAGIFVLSVDRCSESFDRSDEELAIFTRGASETGNVLLELVAHRIERHAKLPDLGDIVRFNACGKVALSDPLSCRRKSYDRRGEPAGRYRTDNHGGKCEKQTNDPGLRTHLADRSKRSGFILHCYYAEIQPVADHHRGIRADHLVLNPVVLSRERHEPGLYLPVRFLPLRNDLKI